MKKPKQSGKGKIVNLQPKNKVFFDEKAHRYTNETGVVYPSVTEVLKFFNIIMTQYSNESSMNFGTAFHHTTKLLDLDNLGEYDKALEPWLNGYRSFIKDYAPKFDLIEQPLISKTFGFCGMPDRVFGSTLLDIKTGNQEKFHSLQLAGYEILIEENYNIRIKKRMCLYIKKDSFKVIEYENKRHVFIGALNLFKWIKANGK